MSLLEKWSDPKEWERLEAVERVLEEGTQAALRVWRDKGIPMAEKRRRIQAISDNTVRRVDEVAPVGWLDRDE